MPRNARSHKIPAPVAPPPMITTRVSSITPPLHRDAKFRIPSQTFASIPCTNGLNHAQASRVAESCRVGRLSPVATHGICILGYALRESSLFGGSVIAMQGVEPQLYRSIPSVHFQHTGTNLSSGFQSPARADLMRSSRGGTE